MKNELGPLLGEGTQENLSFWRRCPLSPCKRQQGKSCGEEERVRKERREDFLSGGLVGSRLWERAWEEQQLGCPESSVGARAGARSCREVMFRQEHSGEGLALWEPGYLGCVCLLHAFLQAGRKAAWEVSRCRWQPLPNPSSRSTRPSQCHHEGHHLVGQGGGCLALLANSARVSLRKAAL